MKLIVEIHVQKFDDYDGFEGIDVIDEIAGAVSGIEEFEGCSVAAKILEIQP